MRIDVDCPVGELVFQHVVFRSDDNRGGVVSFTGKSSVLQKSGRTHMTVKLHDEDGRDDESIPSALL